MRRKSLDDTHCTVARSLDVIGDWWSLLIVRDALAGIKRFGEFERSLGLAKNILSARLKTLVAEGIFEVRPASDGTAYREYVLTGKGRALFPVIMALSQWGSDFLFEGSEARTRPRDLRDGKPIARIQIRSDDGRPLEAGDIESIVA